MIFLPKWLTANFRVKIGMFVLAALLWFLVVTDRTYESVIDIPIQFVQIKPNRTLTDKVPTVARVMFQATGKELLQLKFLNHPSLQINLSTINEYYTFYPTVDMIAIPGEAVALDILEPDSILVLLDERVEISLPVMPDIKASTAPGYTLAGDFLIEPEEVTVTGPKDKLRGVKSVGTSPVELADLKKNVDLEVTIHLPYQYGTTISHRAARVGVRVERLGERSLVGMPIAVVNAPTNREIILEPASADVKISGGISVLSHLKADSIRVWVDYHDYRTSTGDYIPLKMSTSAPVELIKIAPEQVRIILRRMY